MSSSNFVVDKRRAADLDLKVRDGLVKVGANGTSEDLITFYNDNGKEYDEMSSYANYGNLACHNLVLELSALVPDKNANVLEVAAGSGYGGKELRKHGYNNITALEPAEKFLDLAKSQNVYKNYILDAIVVDKQCSIGDETYDAVVIMGSVLRGHVELDCLPELIRITKKGGVIVFNISENYLKSGPDYAINSLECRFQSYIDKGVLKKWDVIANVPYRYSETCSIFRLIST